MRIATVITRATTPTVTHTTMSFSESVWWLEKSWHTSFLQHFTCLHNLHTQTRTRIQVGLKQTENPKLIYKIAKERKDDYPDVKKSPKLFDVTEVSIQTNTGQSSMTSYSVWPLYSATESKSCAQDNSKSKEFLQNTTHPLLKHLLASQKW